MLGSEPLRVPRAGTRARDLRLLRDTPGATLRCPCGGWGRQVSSTSRLISRRRCQTSSTANRGSPGAAGKQQKVKTTEFRSSAEEQQGKKAPPYKAMSCTHLRLQSWALRAHLGPKCTVVSPHMAHGGSKHLNNPMYINKYKIRES